MFEVIIDFETKSACDIQKGVDSYASDPQADILCIAVCPTDPADMREWSWLNHSTSHFPSQQLLDILDQADKIWAHNARFDQAMWEYIAVAKYGFPEKRADQWACTMSLARINGLPAGLDKACRAADLTHKKNVIEGNRLIRKLCIPDKNGQFQWNLIDAHKLLTYCTDDIRATKELFNACAPMSKQDHEDWLINEGINDRGVLIDMDLARAGDQYVAAEKFEISQELKQLTQGALWSPSQHKAFPAWVLSQAKHTEPYMVKYDKGERKMSLDKEHMENILVAADDGELALPDHVYNALQCKSEAGGAATAKFKRMLLRADPDDRVRGEFIHFGATTGRFTSRGIQLHNFKRDCFSVDDAETIRAMMMSGQVLGGAVIPTLGKMLRPTLIPEQGKVFVVGDWSQVENRALPFLANSKEADTKLQLFRDIDADPTRPDTYEVAAADAGFDDRQIGKVIELSLGYLGGNGAFASMAKNYGVRLPDHEVTRIVKHWRNTNKWAVTFGNKLQAAATGAIRSPHNSYRAGLVTYQFNPNLLGGSLICKLPCGTNLTYPFARLNMGKYGHPEISALKANVQPKADDTNWPRFTLWRGLLAENVTQAFCASLLRDLLRRVPDIILHCHDEVVVECDILISPAVRYELKREMHATPTWAQGLPLKAEPKIVTRYGK